MIILAIESSDSAGSVALLADGRLLAAIELDPTVRSARTLPSAMDRLLREAQVEPRTVDVVAVAVGPGSFTGLRVGITAAKVFAYAADAKIVAIDTLTIIARGVSAADASCETPCTLRVVLDAQRGDLFASSFTHEVADGSFRWKEQGGTTLISSSEWLAELQPGDRVAGKGIVKHQSKLSAFVTVVPQEQWQPRAEQLGQLAFERALNSEFDDLWTLAPKYLRLSAAEEKRASS